MWLVFALLAALSAAIVVVLSKAGVKKIDSSLVFAIQAVLILIVSWLTVFIQKKSGDLSKIDKKTWIYIVVAGIITALSSLATFRALKLGEASQVSPIERTSLVFVIIFAAFFLKERITWQVAIGAGLMTIGAVVIALAKKTS